MAIVCHSCGTDNEGLPRVCGHCGVVLGAPPDPPAPPPQEMVMLRNPPMPRPPPPEVRLPPPIPQPWRETLSADPVEHDLLVAIRANPADTGTRMVYADWLERADLELPARFVRHEGYLSREATTQIADPPWRRITSRTPIECCGLRKCPKRWDLLIADPEDEAARICEACARAVRYCETAGEAAGAASHDRPIAIDAEADASELITVHQRALIRVRR